MIPWHLGNLIGSINCVPQSSDFDREQEGGFLVVNSLLTDGLSQLLYMGKEQKKKINRKNSRWLRAVEKSDVEMLKSLICLSGSGPLEQTPCPLFCTLSAKCLLTHLEQSSEPQLVIQRAAILSRELPGQIQAIKVVSSQETQGWLDECFATLWCEYHGHKPAMNRTVRLLQNTCYALLYTVLIAAS